MTIGSNAAIDRAEQFAKSGQLQQAVAVLRDILAKDADSFEANYALGVLYDRAGRTDLSLPLLRHAVQLRPSAFDVLLHLGIVERDQELLVDALAHLEAAITIQSDSATAHSALASVYVDRNDRDAAIKAFLTALALEPENSEINTKLASLYAMSGDADKAAAGFRAAIRHDPLCGGAHYGLAFLQPTTEHGDDIAGMEQALLSEKLADADRVLVGLALGKACEDRKQYNRSFELTCQANQLQHELTRYSFAEQERMFDRHRQALNQEFIDHCKRSPISDDTPIFVLGMPRSGTSLVEQILASHPSVHGAGEVEYTRFLADEVRRMTGRPFPEAIGTLAPEKLRELGLEYIRKLKGGAGQAQRVVDKLPHNFLRVGLFAALMPNAKIVLCGRDPLDNCVSIYQHQFSADHGYASDLAELGEYYRLYSELMSFWIGLFPDRIYRISYEQLVADADGQIRELLRYCELPFHSNCLSFYEAERMVVTPSALQVREPLHSRSIGRARKYEQHLQPLIEALGRNDSIA